MYRSVMEQVAYFLDRAHKSLEILHTKDCPKDKRRVPRSRSVHAVVVHADPSPSRVSTSSPSPSGSSRFTRAKSVTQMSPSVSSIRDFTWSVLRKNDPVYCTTPRAKPSQDLNKSHDGVYQEPKQSELNPDEIPPEKLSQEAFRLLRLVDSLLATREPDLARVTPIEDNGSSPSPTERHHYHDVSASLQSGNFVNSTSLQESSHVAIDRGNESSIAQGDSAGSCFVKTPEMSASLQATLPRTRRSPDAASWNSSSSSKATEEEDTVAAASPKQLEKKEPPCKAKSPVSVSSAESESGFSSISSFQEVGLPSASSIRPIKGCHTEVGLPEVPLDKTRHRRWTSTPAELQALYKLLYSQHRGSFGGTQATSESVSVCWV
ncbi:hypothetical protein EAI_05749 [Harpegnathos saltator]|uniref:Uncharacterized protein n=2 Tax=Harpegnathos saltator TaxID=610380 RepID=E2BM49_HARSA|nr:hypothetical protein EAI_05749 [Harpegnathos saltator]